MHTDIIIMLFLGILWCDLGELLDFLKEGVEMIEKGDVSKLVHAVAKANDNASNPREEQFWENSWISETGRIRLKFLKNGNRWDVYINNFFDYKGKPEEVETGLDERNFGTVCKMTQREINDFVRVVTEIKSKCLSDDVMMGLA